MIGPSTRNATIMIGTTVPRTFAVVTGISGAGSAATTVTMTGIAVVWIAMTTITGADKSRVAHLGASAASDSGLGYKQ